MAIIRSSIDSSIRNPCRRSLAFATIILALQIGPAQAAESEGSAWSTRSLNNGQLILQDVPEIPQSIATRLNQYQNVRSAGLVDWTEDGNGMYITTRFSQISQVHRVNYPGGARQQLTFFDEPMGEIDRQERGSTLALTMDRGGSEFSQIFLLNPKTAIASMVTDGLSRNVRLVWDQSGKHLAYQSTRRNGRSNDIWMMEVDNPETARPVYETPDDHWWAPVDFTEDGKSLLIQQYVGAIDSRIYLLDLESGEKRLLAGDPEMPSANRASIIDRKNEGFYMISNARGLGAELAWQSLEPGTQTEFITTAIPWDVTEFALSDNGKRGAFTTNEDGISRLYLLNTKTNHYSLISNMPVGLIFSLRFHPDNRRLAMTLNTARSPSDVYVMHLGRSPEKAG